MQLFNNIIVYSRFSADQSTNTQSELIKVLPMSTTPKADGFHAPAEWEPHSATLIGWPWRGEIWPELGKRAWRPFLDVIQAVSTSEKVIVIPKPGNLTI